MEIHQCTSQVVRKTTLTPFAPALAHEPASSKMAFTRSRTEGRALSKTHELRCLQISHGVSRVMGV
jgi:hypothetical protein